jgi:tRNA G18 (ribose-2'-O)-methylase SpoU
MKKLKLEELGRLSVDAFKASPKLPICVLLDNVRSLHNVGSAFRTADAFRIQNIYLTGITGTPPHREIQKTALGATDSVSWSYAEDPLVVIDDLRKQGYKIVAVEQTDESVPLHQFAPRPNERLCVVFGNEVTGVAEQIVARCDIALEIPQAGTKHSQNISVCLGIVLWEAFKKLTLQ